MNNIYGGSIQLLNVNLSKQLKSSSANDKNIIGCPKVVKFLYQNSSYNQGFLGNQETNQLKFAYINTMFKLGDETKAVDYLIIMAINNMLIIFCNRKIPLHIWALH